MFSTFTHVMKPVGDTSSETGIPVISLYRLLTDRVETLGNLSKDVFERRTSTGSEVFSLLICLDANKFVLLSFSSLKKTIYPRVSTEPLPNDTKSPLPVDVCRSKTLLLKLAIEDPEESTRTRRTNKQNGDYHGDDCFEEDN